MEDGDSSIHLYLHAFKNAAPNHRSGLLTKPENRDFSSSSSLSSSSPSSRMAASKCYYPRPGHRFLCVDQKLHNGTVSGDPVLELSEWDIHATGKTGHDPSEFSHVIDAPSHRASSGTSSLPINIPDWSETLRGDHQGKRRWEAEALDGELGEWGAGVRVVPPHVFLARTRVASSSVQEGAGRTLKGRDLSRVRNAIFEITGFQD